DFHVTGVQTCALPICRPASRRAAQVAPSLAPYLLDGEPFPAGASLTARRQGTERRVDSVRGVLVAGGLGRLELLAQLGFELGREIGRASGRETGVRSR